MNYFCAECLRAIDYIDTQIPAYRKTIAPPRGWLAARLYHPEWLHYSIFLTARNLADAERGHYIPDRGMTHLPLTYRATLVPFTRPEGRPT